MSVDRHNELSGAIPFSLDGLFMNGLVSLPVCLMLLLGLDSTRACSATPTSSRSYGRPRHASLDATWPPPRSEEEEKGKEEGKQGALL